MFSYGDSVWCPVHFQFLYSFKPSVPSSKSQYAKFVIISDCDNPNKVLLVPNPYKGWRLDQKNLETFKIPQDHLNQMVWCVHQSSLWPVSWDPCELCGQNFVLAPHDSSIKCWECSL